MVKLVKYHNGHKESLVRLLNNINVTKWLLAVDVPYTPEEADWWINKCREAEESDETFPYAVETNGIHIGGIGLHKKNAHTYEVGYWLGEEYWGNGFMTEAVRIITDIAFNDIGIIRLQAHTFENNTGSQKVLRKNDYEFEGLIKKVHEKNGIFHNSKLFAKVI